MGKGVGVRCGEGDLGSGDLKVLIGYVNGACSIPWKICLLLGDIHKLFHDFEGISFVHVCREINFVNDKLTALEHSISSDCHCTGLILSLVV
ncbi:hypothetical protein DVH24_034823 [Malus domestica]|uniref:Uncharacterized protein n=1 Tax=Malus domestica TaxID=3750 RepID=A0A498IH92_MALDO|nr:hypothetical protein DVH24_034823 [Malus domestica]